MTSVMAWDQLPDHVSKDYHDCLLLHGTWIEANICNGKQVDCPTNVVVSRGQAKSGHSSQ